MSDQTSRFVGTFSGIHFGVKQKKGEPVQTAGLNFDVELDETSIAQVTGIIGLQKQQVYLGVSRRQASLFGEDPPPQGKLPLTGRDGDRPEAPPEPAEPYVATEALAEGTWLERDAIGDDGVTRGLLIRTCGRYFLCRECGQEFVLDPGDGLPDAYILSSMDRTRTYRFVPHNGLERMD